MLDRSKYFGDGSFLKAPNITNGQIVTIEKFEELKTRLSTEERPVQPILRLKGIEKPLGLNATNFDMIVAKYGENEKAWIGKKIKLLVVKVQDPSGKTVDGIRISS